MTLKDCDPPDPRSIEWHSEKGPFLDPYDAFVGWISPVDAVAHLTNSGARQSYIDGLLNRLRNGFLCAAAAQAAWRDEELRLVNWYRPPLAIQPDWWNQAEGFEKHNDPLWMMADLFTRIYSPARGAWCEVQFTGLRFDPRGLEPDLGSASYKRIARVAQAKANRINAESDAGPPPPVTVEEFADYLSPIAVLAALPPWSLEAKIDAIASRLVTGMIVAIAEHMSEGNSPPEQYYVVPRRMWKDWAPHGEHGLWERGDCKFVKPTNYGHEESRWKAFNVKFDPLGVSKMLSTVMLPAQADAAFRQAQTANRRIDPYAEPAPSHNPRPTGTLEQIAPELGAYAVAQTPEINVPKNVPPDPGRLVTPREFDAWYAAQTPEIRLWGGAKLRQKCSQDHGGRRVVKKATDDITRGRKTGRKTGSKNVPR